MFYQANNPPRSPWYHRWWGIVLITLGVVVVVGVAVVIGTTIKYWWQISHGIAPDFVKEIPGNFTSVNGLGGTGTIDRAALETVDSPMLGRIGAPITIVEFVDFKCPNCRIAAPVVRQIDAFFHNKVHIIARFFPPSDSFHPGATDLSYLAYCASKQGKYWELSDVLFNEQSSIPYPLTEDVIRNLSERLSIDADKVIACMHESNTKAIVNRDFLAGVAAGVRGTPTFFVNGEKVEGAIPYDIWKRFLDAQ